jgi:antibiotic biosynthesis monooxygenase (ABM) superfamily enzyme
MIWLAVFPTLTALQLLLGDLLDGLPLVARTFALSTLVVPLVVYLILPRLQRVRAALVSRS